MSSWRSSVPNEISIIGIDPALSVSGYGIVTFKNDRYNLISAGEIKTSGKNALPYRLHKIYSNLRDVLTEFKPQVAVLEEGFFSKNHKIAMSLGQARGAAMVACAECGLEIRMYAVREIKQAVAGRGSASKEQVAYMVRMLLGLNEDEVSSHDITDALSVAICAAQKIDSEEEDVRVHKW